MNDELVVSMRKTVDAVAASALEGGSPWASLFVGSALVPEIPNTEPLKLGAVMADISVTFQRLCADRIASEIRRCIPEEVLVTVGEADSEYNDQGGCYVFFTSDCHVLRDEEWVSLEGHWKSESLEQDVRDLVQDWVSTLAVCNVDEESQVILEPVNPNPELLREAAEVLAASGGDGQ